MINVEPAPKLAQPAEPPARPWTVERRLQWYCEELFGAAALELRQGGNRCELWVGGDCRCAAHASRPLDLLLSHLRSTLERKLASQQKARERWDAGDLDGLTEDPFPGDSQRGPSNVSRDTSLPGPRWKAPLELRCTVPAGDGEAREILITTASDLGVAITDLADGIVVGRGVLDYPTILWEAEMKQWPRVAQEMIERYLFGILRVFAEGLIHADEWTNDVHARHVLRPRRRRGTRA